MKDMYILILIKEYEVGLRTYQCLFPKSKINQDCFTLIYRCMIRYLRTNTLWPTSNTVHVWLYNRFAGNVQFAELTHIIKYTFTKCILRSVSNITITSHVTPEYTNQPKNNLYLRNSICYFRKNIFHIWYGMVRQNSPVLKRLTANFKITCIPTLD